MADPPPGERAHPAQPGVAERGQQHPVAGAGPGHRRDVGSTAASAFTSMLNLTCGQASTPRRGGVRRQRRRRAPWRRSAQLSVGDPARPPGDPVAAWRRGTPPPRRRGGVHVGFHVAVARRDRPGERLGGVLVTLGGAATVGERQRRGRVEVAESGQHATQYALGWWPAGGRPAICARRAACPAPRADLALSVLNSRGTSARRAARFAGSESIFLRCLSSSRSGSRRGATGPAVRRRWAGGRG